MHKLGINFSWEESDKESANIVLLTPKSSILYNYISSHGDIEIENEEYKEMMRNYYVFNKKYIFDYEYCYEVLSVSHLIEQMEKDAFENPDGKVLQGHKGQS